MNHYQEVELWEFQKRREREKRKNTYLKKQGLKTSQIWGSGWALRFKKHSIFKYKEFKEAYIKTHHNQIVQNQ